MFVRIFATLVPAFFMREKPISSMANPACMNKHENGGDNHPQGVDRHRVWQRPVNGLG